MDSSISEIEFDLDGKCNFCSEAKTQLAKIANHDDSSLEGLLHKIRADGVGKPYDCIVGVSGGVDSSWVLVNAVRLGLRPLAVHMDNTWNTELATNNVANLISSLGVDLHTVVLDSGIYNKMLRAHMEADVLDLEILYDNALHAVVYEAARKQRLHYILSGFNQATEGVRIPASWSSSNKFNARNIRKISRLFGGVRKTFPLYSNSQWLVDTIFRRIRWVPFLDFLDHYSKSDAELDLVNNFGYKTYAHKHYENTLTKVYQGFILPKKFNVDKRKPHLSSLVVNGDLTREQALLELTNNPLGTEQEERREVAKFLRKMDMSPTELELYLSRPMRQQSEFGDDILLKLRHSKLGEIAFAALRRNAQD
jgi:hypothetical protein